MVARGRGLVGDLNGMHRHPERSGKTRLTERDALTIRALKGSATQAQIAVRFGISRASVSDIVRRTRWGHVDALAT
jgi:DNA-binding CsgD family transcriptional regulator